MNAAPCMVTLLLYWQKKIMLFHKNPKIDFKTTKRTDVLFLSNNCTFIIPENRIIKRLSFSTWNKSKLREIEDFQIPKSLSMMAKLYFAQLAKKKNRNIIKYQFSFFHTIVKRFFNQTIHGNPNLEMFVTLLYKNMFFKFTLYFQ